MSKNKINKLVILLVLFTTPAIAQISNITNVAIDKGSTTPLSAVDPRFAPGVFPLENNGFAHDIEGTPRYGKYPGDRPDIGAYEYVPDELKNEKGKYIQGSYIREDGSIFIPGQENNLLPPMSLRKLAWLKQKDRKTKG